MMFRGRLLYQWDQTALIWSQQANSFRGEGSDAASVYDVHPLRTEAGRIDIDEGLEKNVDTGFWQRIKLIQSLPDENQGKVLESVFQK